MPRLEQQVLQLNETHSFELKLALFSRKKLLSGHSISTQKCQTFAYLSFLLFMTVCPYFRLFPWTRHEIRQRNELLHTYNFALIRLQKGLEPRKDTVNLTVSGYEFRKRDPARTRLVGCLHHLRPVNLYCYGRGSIT